MQNPGSVASFRKLTPAMMRSQHLALANDIVETTKGEVAMALKKAAPALGVDGTCYHILDILLGLTCADDWQPNRRPIVAISNEKLAEYVCRSKRTVMRCVKRLVEAGVIAYRDSPTGRRYVHRGEFKNGKMGEIERGFGFDFSPARQRVQELRALGEDFAAKLKAQKDAKRSINRLLRAIEDMKLLADQESMPIEDICEQVEKVLSTSMMLEEKAEVLALLYETLVSRFAEQQAHQEDAVVSISEEMTCEGDINVIPYNNTNPQSLESSSDNRRSAYADHSQYENSAKRGISLAFEKSTLSKFREKSASNSNAAGLDSVSIDLLISATHCLRETLGSDYKSWPELIASQRDMALLIGLSPSALAQAQERVGQHQSAAVLATTVEKSLRDPHLISNPAGYFRACIDRAAVGELALHKSLFGLVSN
ncbi:replication protein C [Rhodobacteraceae bacterium RKSG542]|uniref:plasmid replication protein RepC n=1 Tax=Pseudovibrio flavus TaxID=2529854 RepID=UPI0012BBB58A|nr:plasmid replication protein RepC [Pseudovibrio flavus]MTI15912.1 replication protein C [Pseudovibrio flavus]